MRQGEDPADIAIIGMACRFPGATTPRTFWNNLCQGVESITFFSDEELLAAGVEPWLLRDSNYVKAAPILEGVDTFDASFFEYSPKEATLMDPQHRLFLEVAWEAFEDAGYHPESYDGVVGVFAGGGGVVTSYLVAHQGHPIFPGQTAGLQHIGNDKDFLSTRVSYKLNLTGPSVTVQTACSTSLVAVHLACQSLLVGECDMVLAGAATVRIPHISGYLAEKGHVQSLDGHCRAFDAGGKGTIFGSGVGAVLLKTLPDALANGDHIYAVIKGTAVNNDGAMKVSYTAPSVAAQARAMVEAFARAGVPPETAGYVECHATGTTVGDPLEIQALTRAFRTQTARARFCAVGSVKTNIGHPEQTAGLAGLLKTALALHHKQIPPSLHFVTPNPHIDFATSPFYVNTELNDWPAGGHPRRAGVNSLGIGGTNAFAVLEEAPGVAPVPAEAERPVHLFTLSAKDEAALRAFAERFQAFLASHPHVSLADLCYTCNVSRSHLPCRLAVTTEATTDLRDALAAFLAGTSGAAVSSSKGKKKPLAFLFTGQGSQYPGMASQLYQTQPTFREVMDECNALLRPHLDRALLDVLFARGEDAALLHETGYTQPALFAVEYALAQLWRAWGVLPGAVMGHSIGELVAACVAGVLDLKDALRLVAERGRHMQGLPRQGAMAAVLAAEEVVGEFLTPHGGRVAIAAVNSPQNTVISGEREAVTQILETLKARGISSKALTVSHAFHSPLMDPILDAFEDAASSLTYREPRIPLISNLTGRPMEKAPDPRYWRDHVRHAVRFADGMRALQFLGYELFLEIGPGNALLGMGRQSLPQVKANWLPSLGTPGQDWRAMLEALRQLYLEGFPINWQMVGQGCSRRRMPLPTYPFQRKRFWLDAAPPRKTPVAAPATASGSPLLGARVPSGPREVRFESVYGLQQLPYLEDHRIDGMVVLPTTAGIEAALAAGRAHFGVRDLLLEDLMYHEAFVVPEQEARPVRVVLTPQGNKRAAFQLLSNATNGREAWRTHLSGVVRTAEGPAPAGEEAPGGFSPDEAQARCPREIPPERYYQAVRALGLEYGPAFQGIQQLRQGEGEAVAKVSLPSQLPAGPHGLHPAFLDACLHIYPAVVREYGSLSEVPDQRGHTYLPIGLERFRVYRDHVTEGWTHAVLRENGRGRDSLVIDIRLYDTESNVVAAFDGLSLRRLPLEHLRPAAAEPFLNWLYAMGWEERPPSSLDRAAAAAEPVGWLIFADGGGVGAALAELLRQRGARCHLVRPEAAYARTAAESWTLDPVRPEDFQRLVREVSTSGLIPCGRVVYLWGLDAPALHEMTLDRLEMAQAAGTGGALFLAQALAEARSLGVCGPRLWFITRNAQDLGIAAAPTEAAQAPLWGLGRTLSLEYPSMWGGLIDLPPAAPASPRSDAEALATELLRSDREDQVALRDGRRFVARLKRLPEDGSPADAVTLREDATYLISGGLGMLGLKIARWLVERGARSLVLTGRRGAEGVAQDTVRALEALGARVHVMKADVSVEGDVRRLLEDIQRHLPPLKGVIHCAGTLDDGILSQMDWPRFRRATAPKINGGWLLHQHTRHLELDCFVLQSSMLSLTGSAGQANYTAGNAFLDALVGHRRALGLPAMAINWGPWDEAGMATASGSRGEAMWRARGVGYIRPEDGMRAFDYLMRRRPDHAAVAGVDWAVYLEQFPEPPPVYAEVAQAAGPRRATRASRATQDVQARLRQAPPQDRRNVLVDFLRGQVMDVLGFEEPIDTARPLNELGLDSLMSVNLVNRLEAALGLSLPVVKLIQGPSLDQLVEDLIPELAGRADPGPATATAPPDQAAAPAGAATLTAPAVPREPVRTAETAGNGWLVFPRPHPAAAMRLFCFPFAGGGAATYRPWADALHPAIEVVAIEPPGRASRIHEPPVRTLEAFLEMLVPTVAPYLDRPCAFFGHCLGGLTVYETLRQLRTGHALPLEHLFVSGARAPHRVALEGPFEEHLLAKLLTHDTFDPFLPAHEQPDEVFGEVIRHFNMTATDEFLDDPELRRLLLPTIRAEFAMTANYRFTPEPPWDVPITCFVGADDPYVTRDDAVGWSHYTKVGFHLYKREGTHFLVVDDRAFILETITRELGV